MKNRTAMLLAGILISAAVLSGCGTNEATKAANESIETEREGSGEAVEEEKEAEEEKESKENEAVNEEISEETKVEKSDEKADTEDEEKKTDSEITETKEEPETAEEAKVTEEPETAEETNVTEEPEETKEVIGILLPSEERDFRWERDGETMSSYLTEAGYDPQIRYANEDSDTQIAQIEEMILTEAEAMIIAPVDEYSLVDILAEAKEASIPVFSYDSLIMDTSAVSYYATFDMRAVGHMIGEQIVKSEKLEELQAAKESRSMEFLMGSPDDMSALFLYNGIIEILQEYFDDGTLVCPSGKMSFDDTGIMRNSSQAAEKHLQAILEEFYPEGKQLDILCTADDSFAIAAIAVLEEAGYEPHSDNWPMITGVGCDAQAVRNVAEGKQAFSIFMDNRTLAKECAKLAETKVKGDTPEVNDYEQYDNGVKIIGTYTCKGQLIDADNYQILIDNGYYSADEVEPVVTSTPVPTLTPTEAPVQKPTVKPDEEESVQEPTVIPDEEESAQEPAVIPDEEEPAEDTQENGADDGKERGRKI